MSEHPPKYSELPPRWKWWYHAICGNSKQRKMRKMLSRFIPPLLPVFCPACGVYLNYEGGSGRGPQADSPSINRLDPKGSYVYANIEILCCRCNSAMRDLSEEELFRLAYHKKHQREKRSV